MRDGDLYSWPIDAVLDCNENGFDVVRNPLQLGPREHLTPFLIIILDGQSHG